MRSLADVQRAIERAKAYLERACGPDGRFVYQVDVTSGRENSSYNVLRHAGAIYALATVNRLSPDQKAIESILKAAVFLRRNYVGLDPSIGQLIIWSNPLGQSFHGQFAELGGTALGVVALASVRDVDPNAFSLRNLQALGHFILFLQQQDGSFAHKYLAERGPVTNWKSLYYPGEAALGLVALYEQDHSQEWLQAAAKALMYLAKSRSGLDTVPADHWALIATAKLLPYCSNDACAQLREPLIRHAVQICNSILREQLRTEGGRGTDGAFDPTGRTTPTATRLEGLLAALEFLPQSEMRRNVEEASQRSAAFLLRSQIPSGPYAGGLPGSMSGLENSTVRIDFVQHALCAWISYWKYFHKR